MERETWLVKETLTSGCGTSRGWPNSLARVIVWCKTIRKSSSVGSSPLPAICHKSAGCRSPVSRVMAAMRSLRDISSGSTSRANLAKAAMSPPLRSRLISGTTERPFRVCFGLRTGAICKTNHKLYSKFFRQRNYCMTTRLKIMTTRQKIGLKRGGGKGDCPPPCKTSSHFD